MDVRARWVIDSWRGTAFAAGPDGVLHGVKDVLMVAGMPIEVGVGEMFAELERLERRAQG